MRTVLLPVRVLAQISDKQMQLTKNSTDERPWEMTESGRQYSGHARGDSISISQSPIGKTGDRSESVLCASLNESNRKESIDYLSSKDVRRPYTVKDVAQLAGVSTATVSRVVNGISKVSSDTKSKVLRAASILGYSPNAHASELARTKVGITRKRRS